MIVAVAVVAAEIGLRHAYVKYAHEHAWVASAVVIFAVPFFAFLVAWNVRLGRTATDASGWKEKWRRWAQAHRPAAIALVVLLGVFLHGAIVIIHAAFVKYADEQELVRRALSAAGLLGFAVGFVVWVWRSPRRAGRVVAIGVLAGLVAVAGLFMTFWLFAP